MVTEALSSEETTVEVAITAVSGLSSYFSAVVALAVAATAITAADVDADPDLFLYFPGQRLTPLFGPQLFTIFQYSFFACAALFL